MKKGKFIVLEGIDGAGTTTQVMRLANYLFDKNKINVPILTREPTLLTEYGKEIRRRLKGDLLPEEKVIDDGDYWANLYVTDRKWHSENVIVPNINNGLIVISDRHKFSTLAYQSAQGADMEKLIEMHQGLYKPDLTLFLDVSIDQAFSRMGNRDEGIEYFEKKDFLTKVITQYHHAISLVGEEQNTVIVDGNKGINEVYQEIITVVNDKLNL
jgi:dTMP kinase